MKIPRIRLTTATRWRLRNGTMMAKSFIPTPLKPQRVHLGYYNSMNFGDLLSPAVTEFVLGRPVVEGHYAGCDLVAIGSVLQPLERWRNPNLPFIWGAGFIEDGPAWRGARAIPVAVRGELTRDRLRSLTDTEIPLGDPGLFVRRLWPDLKNVQKRYKVSLIPHLNDRGSEQITTARKAWDFHIIDVAAGPKLVLEQIAASDLVLSSSLHGLVCADALGVPNIWCPLTGGAEGLGYKFRDYYSAFGLEPRSVDLRTGLGEASGLASEWTEPPGIDQLLDSLTEAFPRSELLARYRR